MQQMTSQLNSSAAQHTVKWALHFKGIRSHRPTRVTLSMPWQWLLRLTWTRENSEPCKRGVVLADQTSHKNQFAALSSRRSRSCVEDTAWDYKSSPETRYCVSWWCLCNSVEHELFMKRELVLKQVTYSNLDEDYFHFYAYHVYQWWRFVPTS